MLGGAPPGNQLYGQRWRKFLNKYLFPNENTEKQMMQSFHCNKNTFFRLRSEVNKTHVYIFPSMKCFLSSG